MSSRASIVMDACTLALPRPPDASDRARPDLLDRCDCDTEQKLCPDVDIVEMDGVGCRRSVLLWTPEGRTRRGGDRVRVVRFTKEAYLIESMVAPRRYRWRSRRHDRAAGRECRSRGLHRDAVRGGESSAWTDGC